MDRFLLRQDIARFLCEDLASGDITSRCIFSGNDTATARFIARERCRTVGLRTVALEVFHTVNPQILCTQALADGTQAAPSDVLLEITGPVRDLLAAERVALNLTQRLCGIATLTACFVAATEGLPTVIVDTRKTTPGLRMLEKYAVRIGGGRNHRFTLADGVLIKDNHIAAAGSIRLAVEQVRQQAPHTLKVEVEAETLDQVKECLDCKVEIIMLDNMSLDAMRQAVALIDHRALVEASGGVTLNTVRAIAETGVDLISVGALTHSAPAVDIGMDLVVTAAP